MITLHTIEIPELLRSFAKGVSRSRGGFLPGRPQSLLASSWRMLCCGQFIYFVLLSLFSDVRDVQSTLMWVAVLQQKGLFIKNLRFCHKILNVMLLER